jgi:hypothetical protein
VPFDPNFRNLTFGEPSSGFTPGPRSASDSLFEFCTIQRFDIANVVQVKKIDYHNPHPTDQFLPLVIEVFGCLQKQTNVFLHDCANVIWSFKRLEGPPLFVLITFLHKQNSITLQRMQTSSIFNQVVAIGLTTSRLSPLQHIPPSPQLTY